MRFGIWRIALVAPLVLVLAIIFVGPFLYMLWLSTTDLSFADSARNGNFIGASNYTRALGNDPAFWGSIIRSTLFAILCVVPELMAGTLIAEFLHTKPFARRLITPLLALPVLLPTVVIGLYWRLMLQGEFGLLSHYLSAIGVPGAKGILSNPDTILYTLAAVDWWQWGPFVALTILAARTSLPKYPLEAAFLDRASSLRAFFDVTLPGLLPTVVLIGIVRFIDSFKEFDKVYILTGGGPGTASELSSIYTWRVAFRQWEFGYAAALCTIIYLLIYVLCHNTIWRYRRTQPV